MSAAFDFLVIGAGPSGSTLSRLLSKRGARVLLTDKGALDEEKVCGGFLGPELPGLLSSIELDWGKKQFHPIQDLLLSGPKTGSFRMRIPRGGGFAVNRDDFDRALREKAIESGALFYPHTLVNHIQKDGAYWRVELEKPSSNETIHTKTIIQATGRRAQQSHSTYFGCKAMYERKFTGAEVQLHFVSRGNVGFNSLGDKKLALCLYAEASHLKKAHGDRDQMLRDLAKENPQIRETLHDAVRISDWKSCQAQPDNELRFFDGQKIYTGDSVGMMHPLVGGGISMAMHSALLLSHCLCAKDKDPSEAIARQYEKKWKNHFRMSFQMARWIGRCQQSSFATEGLLAVLRFSPFLLRRLFLASRPSL